GDKPVDGRVGRISQAIAQAVQQAVNLGLTQDGARFVHFHTVNRRLEYLAPIACCCGYGDFCGLKLGASSRYWRRSRRSAGHDRRTEAESGRRRKRLKQEIPHGVRKILPDIRSITLHQGHLARWVLLNVRVWVIFASRERVATLWAHRVIIGHWA